jgi:hypothetical protein
MHYNDGKTELKTSQLHNKEPKRTEQNIIIFIVYLLKLFVTKAIIKG